MFAIHPGFTRHLARNDMGICTCTVRRTLTVQETRHAGSPSLTEKSISRFLQAPV